MRFILPSLFLYTICYAALEEYKDQRRRLLREEALLSLGGRTDLTVKESDVNNCIMQHKFNELDKGFANPDVYNFSHHFFTYKDKINNSKVYQIIKDMPKGAALHAHDTAMLGPDYILNITYMENLYICYKKDNILLRFSDKTPNIPCPKWKLLCKKRQSSRNVTQFDARLRKYFTLYVDDPEKTYPTIKQSWGALSKYFDTITPLLTYRPVWEQYFYDVLKKFREDKIMYIEIRSTLPSLYDLDGTTYNSVVTAKTFKKATKKFLKDYPDFFGAKLIYSSPRMINNTQLTKNLETAREIKADMPTFFAGFDLVAQEDLGNPLIKFVPQLINASKELNYFFHAGETNWWGTSTDENLIDAILLGTKRIGHAFALPKHPLLMKEVIDRDIGIEVNVISNTVLSLVKDARNHPLTTFIARGVPVVLSSDDPGAWEADIFSNDFYVAFVGVASRLSDLRLLKQLAINSLKYSALSSYDKLVAYDKFKAQWQEFIDHFDCAKY